MCDIQEPLQDFYRVFFWASFLFTMLLLGHSALLIAILSFGMDIPDELRFPRLELCFGYVSLLPITTVGAGLLTKDKGRQQGNAFAGSDFQP